ncbi:MAG: tRNA (guanosine(37)-N1)-methyltransferase TrmD [Myxococcales bacterium]|nr:tRNA (guanosine(37)-N1)-methyltransferase TrmD [Myxococcales bacterium]
MKFIIIGRFPEQVRTAVEFGVLCRALESGRLEIETLQLKDFGHSKHQHIDEKPFGGGAGLVLRVDVVVPALRAAKAMAPNLPVIMLSPQGEPLKTPRVKALAAGNGAILLCGRYEGFDERIRAHVDLEVSVGDFVLTGGELAAACLVDAVARFLPGILGNADSTEIESHSDGLLEAPHYTQPVSFEGQSVPAVLRSGHHGQIEAWRQEQALYRTGQRRPDLIKPSEGD